jgi:hypothetical protein
MVIVQGYYVRRLWAVSPSPFSHHTQNIELKLIDDDVALGLFAIVETTSSMDIGRLRSTHPDRLDLGHRVSSAVTGTSNPHHLSPWENHRLTRNVLRVKHSS